jgi:hypothetical protein
MSNYELQILATGKYYVCNAHRRGHPPWPLRNFIRRPGDDTHNQPQATR